MSERTSFTLAPITAPVVISMLVLAFLLAGCAEEGPSGKAEGDASTPLPSLLVGLMPAVDIAPILVASDEGFFRDEGLDFGFEIYTSAQHRQSALQVGAIDGALTDLVALTLNVAAGFEMRATTSTDGMFLVLGREGDRPAPGDTVSIGLMEVSVTNFLAERWLGEELILEKVYINDIGARLEAAVGGRTDLGVFPEPLASVAVARGLSTAARSSDEEPSPQVMAFTAAAIRDKRGSLYAFHRAYNRAVQAIREDHGLARDALVRHIPAINPDLREAIRLPGYRPVALPEEEFIRTVIDWTAAITNRELAIIPADLVEPAFLP